MAVLRQSVSSHLRFDQGERTLLSLTEEIGLDTSLFVGSGVQLLFEQGLDRSAGSGSFCKSTMSDAGALDSQSFIHDRASSSNELQVGDGTATRRMVGGGGQGPKSAGCSLFQKRADALGVREESFHGLVSTAKTATMTDNTV